VEKDESPKAKALPRLLIVAEGPCQICSFFIYNFFRCNFGPNCFESPYLFLFFCSDTLYVLVFFFNKETFDKICESFSLGSLLNQSQAYQGNPCDIYPDLSSLFGSDASRTS